MGVWAVSSFGLLWIISWPVSAWISADYTLKSEIVRSKSMDTFSCGKHTQLISNMVVSIYILTSVVYELSLLPILLKTFY